MIKESYIESWQSTIDVLAEILSVPAALIMALQDEYIEVFVSSNTDGNPYKKGDKEQFVGSGLYCERAIKTNSDLIVPNALNDNEWKDNPDIELGMISYLGFPLVWPDGKPFGTICVLDNKENSYSPAYIKLLEKFKERIELDLSLFDKETKLKKNNEKLNKALGEIKIFQDVLDHAPAAIYVNDLDGRFTFVNQLVAEVQNVKREDLIGQTLYDFLPKDIADSIHKNDLAVINTKAPMEYEESIPQNDGLHQYLSIKFPLFSEAGELYATAGVSTDITERVRAKESLRISQQRLLLHRDQSPVGVIEWNTDFEFLDWNPAAEKIFGYTKDEVVGVHITKRILPESAREAVSKLWEELLTNKGGFQYSNENITKDGRTILCEWHNTPLIDNKGKVIGVTSLVDDITERQRNEEELRQTQKMDAIGKLTGGIAHDFNNMLGVILGFSELLKQRVGDSDPKLIKYSSEILNAGERAKKLTSKLLNFSRSDTSGAEVTDVNELLYGMQHLLEKTLTARIKIVIEQEENLWQVWLDKTRLEDAILNISINAMHAMPDGGTLTLGTSNMHLAETDISNIDIAPGDYVLLTVSDTGTGMTQEIKEKMFDPFFSTKGSEGTGLGLSQVYGFVQQSGGKIQVYSETGSGTRLALYLPRHQESETFLAEEKPIDKSLDMQSGKETILLVDDEVALLDLTEEILSNYGYTVLRAESAKQALDILKKESIDLMLSDVIMPGMDGYQLATEVEKQYSNVKIQMASGFTDERRTKLANDTIHQQRLHKPYNAEQLLKRIRTLLDEE